jgi:hypothetical protein
MEIPNFDSMTEKELMDFWRVYHRPSKEDAEALLGGRKEAKKICGTLACYAVAKACAISLRLEGEVARAVVYEEACDLAYERLPSDVRW